MQQLERERTLRGLRVSSRDLERAGEHWRRGRAELWRCYYASRYRLGEGNRERPMEREGEMLGRARGQSLVRPREERKHFLYPSAGVSGRGMLLGVLREKSSARSRAASFEVSQSPAGANNSGPLPGEMPFSHGFHLCSPWQDETEFLSIQLKKSQCVQILPPSFGCYIWTWLYSSKKKLDGFLWYNHCLFR